MAYWVYKCNSSGKNGPASGDWQDVFDAGGRVPWGRTDFIPTLHQLKRGDVLLAYQTNRNELVGTVRVLDLERKSDGWTQVYVQSVQEIGVKVRPLKKSDPRVNAIPALQGGIIATLYEITDSDAHHLVRIAECYRTEKQTAQHRVRAPSSPTQEVLRNAVEKAVLAAQGFQANLKVRKAVEQYAVKRAHRHYGRRGYRVVKHGKPFDLECIKPGDHLYVEVKGMQRAGERILLTANEIEFVQQNRMELYLIHSVQIVQSAAGPVASGGTERIISPWRPSADQLAPLAYECTLGEH